MRVRSLGYRTDLALRAHEGVIRVCADYVVVHTPRNPAFYWGNFVLFEGPPGEGDVDRWPAVFAAEVGSPPAVRHLAIGWDTSQAPAAEVLAAWAARGVRHVATVALVADAMDAPPRGLAGAEVRAFASAADWAAWIELDVEVNRGTIDEAAYRPFVMARAAEYQRIFAAGHGEMRGVFVRDSDIDAPRLAASAGLYTVAADHELPPLGRYQAVMTAPWARRRGYCRTLIADLGARALAAGTATRLVILADVDDIAIGIYRRLGFVDAEWQHALERAPG